MLTCLLPSSCFPPHTILILSEWADISTKPSFSRRDFAWPVKLSSLFAGIGARSRPSWRQPGCYYPQRSSCQKDGCLEEPSTALPPFPWPGGSEDTQSECFHRVL